MLFEVIINKFKGNAKFLFSCNTLKLSASWVYTKCHQKRRLPTTDTSHWLDVITIVISFLKIFSSKKSSSHIFFQCFRKFAKKSKPKGHILEGWCASFNFSLLNLFVALARAKFIVRVVLGTERYSKQAFHITMFHSYNMLNVKRKHRVAHFYSEWQDECDWAVWCQGCRGKLKFV